MEIKYNVDVFTPRLIVDAKTLGRVRDISDLKEHLSDIVREQTEIQASLDRDDLTAFYETLKAEGMVEDDQSEVSLKRREDRDG